MFLLNSHLKFRSPPQDRYDISYFMRLPLLLWNNSDPEKTLLSNELKSDSLDRLPSGSTSASWHLHLRHLSLHYPPAFPTMSPTWPLLGGWR